jgi:hypothetical protein
MHHQRRNKLTTSREKKYIPLYYVLVSFNILSLKMLSIYYFFFVIKSVVDRKMTRSYIIFIKVNRD